MTLSQYMTPLRRQWQMIVLFCALGLAAASAYTFTRTPFYQATSEMYVTISDTDGGVQQLQQGSTLAQEKVATYSQIVTVNDVLEKVIQDLSLPYTTGRLRGAIKVTAPINTTLLDVQVVDANPQRAAAIANSVASEFPKMVNDLETPVGRTTSPVKISTLERAEVPGHPFSPRVHLNLALGLLLGLGLGITAAYARDQLNTTIKSIADVEALTGAVPLGITPFDKITDVKPLADAQDSSARAEAYRSLRTNLQFTNVDSPPRVVVVTSSHPDEGKSTTACNLAVTLALGGASTCLIGGDLRKPSVSQYMGISGAVGLTNVLAGQLTLREALVPMMRGKLAVLPAGPKPPNPSELLQSEQMQRVVMTLSEKFEFLVIDAPPVLSVTDASLLAAMADGALVVMRHGKTKREDLKHTLLALNNVHANVLGTIINFMPVKRGNSQTYGYGYNTARPMQERADQADQADAPTSGSTRSPAADDDLPSAQRNDIAG